MRNNALRQLTHLSPQPIARSIAFQMLTTRSLAICFFSNTSPLLNDTIGLRWRILSRDFFPVGTQATSAGVTQPNTANYTE